MEAIAKKRGRPKGTFKGPSQATLDKIRIAVDLRENENLTYRAIGEYLDCSRERVRQYLVKAKRYDLMGLKPQWAELTCPICGTKQMRRLHEMKRIQTCSSACGGRLHSIRHTLKTETATKALIILEERAAGNTWDRARREAGFHFNPETIRFIQKYLEIIGLEYNFIYSYKTKYHTYEPPPDNWREEFLNRIKELREQYEEYL